MSMIFMSFESQYATSC